MTRPIRETGTGLDQWIDAELPDAPEPAGLQWLKVVGPGVIVLGLSLGGGEFLLGPTAFVRYGMSLLWITLVAVFFQTIFNTELMVVISPESMRHGAALWMSRWTACAPKQVQAEHNILWCAVLVMDPHTHSVKALKTYMKQQVNECS